MNKKTTTGVLLATLLSGIIILSFLGLSITYYFYTHPRLILLPYNRFISWYIGQEQSDKVFYSEQEKQQLFPISNTLELNYPSIKQELNTFMTSQHNNHSQDRVSIPNSNLFSSFETALNYDDWNTIPVFVNGNELEYSRKYFPSLMKCIDSSNGQLFTAFFSILEPGKQIEPHNGPFKGVLRYHLGIDIPNGDCFISVNDQRYNWKNGEGVLFDETHLHYAQNNTNKRRIILFIDVIRPLNNHQSSTNSKYVSKINQFVCDLIKIAPHTISCLNEYNRKYT